MVVICTLLIATGVPSRWLSSREVFGRSELGQLIVSVLLFAAWLLPFDFLGGYFLPQKYRKSFESFRSWFRRYLVVVLMQASMFVTISAALMITGRQWGVAGALVVVLISIAGCTAVRGLIWRRRKVEAPWAAAKLASATALTRSLGIRIPPTFIVSHRDIGFTGGVLGIGEWSTIVIPKAWLEAMSTEEIATMLARRAVAISSGSYHRGLIVALLWNCLGFCLATMIPGAGLSTVSGLITTFCGFTLWSFLGLLMLPTVSRNASLQIDQSLSGKGIAGDWLWRSASSFDQLQDDEPQRPKLIEMIFHPLPSVSRRSLSQPVTGFAAWNAARTTLFFSWGCVGLLSRAVHCNVGRPELWTMLPTD